MPATVRGCSLPNGVQWMWADPKLTLFGGPSARFNPLRWSATKSQADAMKEFNSLMCSVHGGRPIRLRRGKVVTLYKNPGDAKQALSGRRGPQVDDWVLAIAISGRETKWFYVPELLSDSQDVGAALRCAATVKAGRRSKRVGHIGEFALARALQKRGYRLKPGVGQNKHSMSAPSFEHNGLTLREKENLSSRETSSSMGMHSALMSPLLGSVLEETEDSDDNIVQRIEFGEPIEEGVVTERQ